MTSLGRSGTDSVFYCDGCWEKWTLQAQWSRAMEHVSAERATQSGGPKAMMDVSTCSSCGSRRRADSSGRTTDRGKWYCGVCWGHCSGQEGDVWYERWLQVRWNEPLQEGAIFPETPDAIAPREQTLREAMTSVMPGTSCETTALLPKTEGSASKTAPLLPAVAKESESWELVG